ncbi:MAG: hypothetical protein AAGA77_13915 [Bacteroidota bacterium]
MKHFEKFKNRLRKEPDQLPQGFDWESMQEGIYEKLDQESDKVNGPFLKRSLLLLLLLIFGASSMWIMMSGEKNQNLNQRSTNITQKSPNSHYEENVQHKGGITTAKTEDISLDSGNFSTSTDRTDETKETYVLLSEEKGLQKQKVISTTNKTKSNSNETKQKIVPTLVIKESYQTKTEIIAQENIQNSILNNSFNIIEDTAILQPRLQQKHNQNSNFATLIESTSKNNYINERSRIKLYFPLLKTLQKSASLSSKSNQRILNAPEIEKISNMPLHKLWKLELSNGWNTWLYGMDQAQYQTDFFRNTFSEYGFSWSARMERKLGKRYGILSGIDIDLLYKEIKDRHITYQDREVKAALTKVKVNAITGKIVDQEFRDTTVVDTIINSFTDFNKISVVSIPILFNYNLIQTSSWTLAAAFGPTVSILTSYQGRYVEDGRLVLYNQSSNNYTRTPRVALNTSLSIQKMFGKEYYVGVRLDLKKHLINWSNHQTTDIKPTLFVGSICIGKSF